MHSTSPRTHLRRPAALCLVAAPLLLTVGDLAGVLSRRQTIHWTVLLSLAFCVFVPAVFALAHLVRTRAPRAGLLLGSVAFLGAMAGASMQAFFRAALQLQQASSSPVVTAAAERAWGAPAFFLTTVAPGLLFPLGLLGLGLALVTGRRVPRAPALLLCVGALLFPVGHAVGLSAALIGGDLVLLAALAWIAAVVLGRPGLWEHGQVRGAA